MAYKFIEEEPKKENVAQEVLRNVARQATNLGTRAIGLPGDILSLANQLVAKPLAEKITGKEALPYEETFLGKAIPTTEFHRKGINEKTGEYLKPKNDVEKFADDIIEDTALLFTPSGKITKAAVAKKAPIAFLKSLGANVGGKIAKDISGSDTASDLTKIGSLFALSLIDKPGAVKKLSGLYKQAESALPKNATTSAERLSSNLQNLENKITQGRPKTNLAESEKFVIDSIDKVKGLINDGEINVAQAWAQKRSLNEELMKKIIEIPEKQGQNRARTLAKQINHFLNDSISQYGKKNPNFYEPFKSAEEGFGTFARSNLLSKFVDKNLKYSPITNGLLHVFGAPIGAAAAKSFIPYQAVKILYRISKSPTLRKHYLETLRSAAKEDAAVFNKQLEKLDEKIQEEQSADRYKFLD